MEPADSIGLEPVHTVDRPRNRVGERLTALFEVVLCSSFPTQGAVIYLLRSVGVAPFDADGGLSFVFVMWLSMLDSCLLVGLIFLFLYAHGESPRDMFLGHRSPAREIGLGLVLIPVIFGVVVVMLLGVLRFSPGLHDVKSNPLEDLIDSRADAGLFAIVAIIAGGIREEIQRAFILRRFERHLGGAVVGLVLFSIVFGLGHVLQGTDAAITTGVLGLIWGIVYLRRGSILAPLVSHAGFDTAEIFRYAVFGR